MKTRLALDLGTNSIGWALFRLNDDDKPAAIIRGGVRIFGDGRKPKDGTSLAVDRRLARQARRMRDRRIKRMKRVMDALVSFNLMPANIEERRLLETLDPYELRKRGLDEKLEPYEFGRAIFHLAKRRGFQSNRKVDLDDDDSSVLKKRIKEVREELEKNGFRTIGEWLAMRKAHGLGTRARSVVVKGGKKGHYDLYVDRAMVLNEFDLLWEIQAKYHPEFLTEEKKEVVYEAISFQRPLRPMIPGRCVLEPEQFRAPIALPSSQRFRILQEVNNIKFDNAEYQMQSLSLEQRDLLVEQLLTHPEVSFAGIRRTLGLKRDIRINLEGIKREKLSGDQVACRLAQDEMFGTEWHSFSLKKQDEIAEFLLEESDEEKTIALLQERYGASEESAQKVASCSLPKGYYRLSRLAMSKVLPELEKDVLVYSSAVQAAGYSSHSALGHTEQSGEIFDELPYYGEILQRHIGFGDPNAESPELKFGKIANPTVHIALGQLRLVVNEVSRQYGRPTQVVLEVTRDLKLSIKQQREVDKEQAAHQKDNERIRSEIAPLLGCSPDAVKRADIKKFQLWEELGDVMNRQCPYSGETIGLGDLFSNKVQVEHILPFAKTLDDSSSNKTVAMLKANQQKGNRTPFEAFGSSPSGYEYEEIMLRSLKMPKNKSWRFRQDAMERYEGERDFLARSLNDTAYVARLAREYLSAMVGPNNIWAVPGRVTGRIRNLWQLSKVLNSEDSRKNRNDHRHHALDAAVVGVVDRGSLKSFSDANKKAGEMLSDRIEAMPMPWATYVEHVKRMVEGIHVSHRPNHGYQRQMSLDTQYGLRDDGKVAWRRSLDSFESRKSLDDAVFADEKLKGRLLALIPSDLSGVEFKSSLAQSGKDLNVRKVRVLKTLNTMPISLSPEQQHRAPRSSRTLTGMEYKGLDGNANYCIEIVMDAKDKWVGKVITTQQAYEIVRKSGEEKLRSPAVSQSGKPLVMRLMRDDVCRFEVNGTLQYMRLCTLRATGQMSFAEINEANVDERDRDKNEDCKYVSKKANSLQTSRCVKVNVSPSGRPSS